MASPVVLGATAKHTATLIFLHGLGDTGKTWAKEMCILRKSHVKVVCPTAPTMPVTFNGGAIQTSWFDVYKPTDESGDREDEQGIKTSANKIHALMENEVSSGIPPGRILLGGFSQGGALALYSALTYPTNLAGVVALSCWLPLYKSFPCIMKVTEDLPILQCHGEKDKIVRYELGQKTAGFLKSMLKNVEFKSYPEVDHTYPDEVLCDVKEFIDKYLPSQ